MTALVTQRVRQLADTLADLKVKVRAALTTELATAVSNAIRDVLVMTLVDRLVATSRYSSSRSRDWRNDDSDRDRDTWGEPRDPWIDDSNDCDHTQTRYELGERDDEKSSPAVPAAAAVAVGVNAARWCFAKKGSIITAVGVGLLATALGMTGGPVARAVLTVLATATDVLTAESVLARTDST